MRPRSTFKIKGLKVFENFAQIQTGYQYLSYRQLRVVNFGHGWDNTWFKGATMCSPREIARYFQSLFAISKIQKIFSKIIFLAANIYSIFTQSLWRYRKINCIL